MRKIYVIILQLILSEALVSSKLKHKFLFLMIGHITTIKIITMIITKKFHSIGILSVLHI